MGLYGKKGICYRFLQICQQLYKNASLIVKTIDGLASEVSVTKGVLQGEKLSSTLFNIYISDFGKFFEDQGQYGVSLNSKNEILDLDYADDIAILANSYANLQTKLKTLQNYCIKKDIEVNTYKTKVVIFHNGNSKKNYKFFYKMKEIEIVKNFTYLGITFSSSGGFNRNWEIKRSSAKLAASSILKIINKTNLNSWQSIEQLFQSLSSSVLLYGCEVWGLKYLNEIDAFQTSFYKRLLHLPTCTPHYAVRLEIGISVLSAKIIERVFNLIIKIARMDNKRNPKICLNVLNDLANRNLGNNKLNNWINSFKIICQNIDKNFVLTYSIGDLEKARDKIINLYLKNKIIEDNEKALSSNSLSYFAFLNHKENCNFYANIKVSLYLQRILAQCRMINRHASRITSNLIIIQKHTVPIVMP